MATNEYRLCVLNADGGEVTASNDYRLCVRNANGFALVMAHYPTRAAARKAFGCLAGCARVAARAGSPVSWVAYVRHGDEVVMTTEGAR